tara:strand:+ start:409 stop:546 length:138 start_codon:yes stop_codon:yes gene_type:complete
VDIRKSKTLQDKNENCSSLFEKEIMILVLNPGSEKVRKAATVIQL